MANKMKCEQFLNKLHQARNAPSVYVQGCFGAPLTAKNVDRYVNNTTNKYNRQHAAALRPHFSKDPPEYGWDCVCLIKGILWGWNENPGATYGGAQYKSNGVPDIGADEMGKRYCTRKDWANIKPGCAVWLPGHIGVYVGAGEVVECTPKWSGNVQLTQCGNTGNTGDKVRTWTSWGFLPWVDYDGVKDGLDDIADKVEHDTPQPVNVNEPSSWAADDWAWAKLNKITDGTMPTSPATREQVIALIRRTLKKHDAGELIDII